VKEQIRDCILKLGADVCGFASVDRFSNAPKGFHPIDIFEECKTVIVFAVALPKGLLQVDSRLIYAHFNEISCPMVDKIAFQTAIIIEKNYNKIAVPLPCDTPYEYWDEESMEGRGLISMKHAAEQAGLGRIGKNSLLINKQYGNMLTIGAVLTNVDIPSDPLSESFCIDSCNICINNCPVKALDGIGAKQKECRTSTYGSTKRGFGTVDCNKCRTICPRRYGID
jgi:epoxyqueuosine reductase QueG